MSAAPEVLIVDDDSAFRYRLGRALTDRGWLTSSAAGAEEALRLVRPSLAFIVVDLRMPDGDGLEAIPEMRRLAPEAVIAVLTGYGSIPTALAAIRLGADEFLSKPIDADRLLEAYRRASSGAPAVETPSLAVPSLARVEWEHIQRVLEECSGNVTRAARLLGIHRRSLQRKLGKRPPSN